MNERASIRSTVPAKAVSDTSPQTPIGLFRGGSVGEALDPATLQWAKERLGITVFEFYGQTEHGAGRVHEPPGLRDPPRQPRPADPLPRPAHPRRGRQRGAARRGG